MSENKEPFQVVFDPHTGLQTTEDGDIRERPFGEYRLNSTLLRWTIKGKKKKKTGTKKRTPKRTPRRPGKKRGK